MGGSRACWDGSRACWDGLQHFFSVLLAKLRVHTLPQRRLAKSLVVLPVLAG